MKEKFNFQQYNNDYKKEHYQRITILISKNEIEVLKKLNHVSNRTKYILDLIKEDVKKNVNCK